MSTSNQTPDPRAPFECMTMPLADGRRLVLVDDFLIGELQQELDVIDISEIAPPRTVAAVLQRVEGHDGVHRILAWRVSRNQYAAGEPKDDLVDTSNELRSRTFRTREARFRTTRVLV